MVTIDLTGVSDDDADVSRLRVPKRQKRAHPPHGWREDDLVILSDDFDKEQENREIREEKRAPARPAAPCDPGAQGALEDLEVVAETGQVSCA